MEKLKILIVTQGVWSPQLGAVKVHIDLKQEYERQGHHVDKISLEDIYPNGRSILSQFFGDLYPVLIHRILKKYAYNYNVIDANFQCIPFPKESFQFKGVLMVRSHGIIPVYKKAEREIPTYRKALELERNKRIRFKTRIGNIYRLLRKDVREGGFIESALCADVVHCLNNAELNYFLEIGIPAHKLCLLPNGISDSFIHKMNQNPHLDRVNSICFIGTWSIRKGMYDMNSIVTKVDDKVSLQTVKLLGVHAQETTVVNAFSKNIKSKIQIIPTFYQDSFLEYVRKCKVGIFPSYVEGFGLAVVEQLACGIPVVAYNVPGPADILKSFGDLLLVDAGNTDEFASKVVHILTMDIHPYTLLCLKCKQVANEFLLSRITESFTETFYEKLPDIL